MEEIYSYSKQDLKKRLDLPFSVNSEGIYLIRVEARTRSEKQLKGMDDEDLRIEIDRRKFPQLDNPQRYIDSPAAFSGGTTRGLRKLIFFILPLKKGKRTISLIPDISASLESIKVLKFPADVSKVELGLNEKAEDGDRRAWITFVLADTGCEKFEVELKLTRRFLDSDDVKVIIDGEVKRNSRSLFRRFWYFIASIFTGESQKETFDLNFSPGLHYIELWADRMPTLETAVFYKLGLQEELSIEEKIKAEALKYGLDPNLMLRIAQVESSLDPNATSPKGAKGLFS